MRRALVATLLLAASSAAATHATDADEAEAQFRLGIRAFQAHDHQAAVAYFLASYRLAPNARVAYDLALAYDALGSASEAYRYLAEVDRLPAPESLRATVAKLRADVEKKVAVLEVRSAVVGAAVYIDRRDLGVRCTTPCVLAIPEGSHEVFVEREGFDAPAPATRTFERGSRTVLTPELRQVEGSLAFTGGVPGVSLRFEGGERVACDEFPCEVSMPPGPQVVIAAAPNHGDVRIPVVVRPRERSEVHVALVRLQGSLAVASHPQGQVFVDGRPRGTAPVSVALPAGEHHVELRAPGYATRSERVRVAPNATTELEVDLEVREDVEAASRRLEEARLAPASVTVITRTEIEAFGYPTLTEALRGVRGMFLTDDSLTQSTEVRGFAEPGGYCSGMLVLLDDKPLNNPYFGGACSGVETIATLDDVERIEIIRGPTSALFGSGAFLATIQIVTRAGAAERRAELRAATYGNVVGRVGARFDAPTATGSLYGAVTVGATNTPKSYVTEFRDAAGTTEPATDVRDKPLDGWLDNGATGGSVSSMLGYDSASWKVRVYTHRNHRVLATAPYAVVVNDPRSYQTESRLSFDARYAFPLGAGTASVRASSSTFNLDARYVYRAPIGIEYEEFRGTALSTEARWDGPLLGARLSVGADGRSQLRARLQTGNEGEGNKLNASDAAHYAGAFGQLFFDLARGVHVTAATRFDYDPRVPNPNLWLFTSPRLALVSERIEGGTTKLLFGKAFRAATTLERIYEASGWLSNLAIEPEQVVSLELQHRQDFGRVALTGSVFGNRVQNVILLREVEPGTFQFGNSPDEVRIFGLEGEARVQLPRAMQLAAQGSLTRRSKVGNEVEVETNIPSWLAGVKFIAPLSVAGATFAARASLEGGRRMATATAWGATFTDPSARVDAVLSMPVPGLAADVKLGVYNLFDAITNSVPTGSLVQQVVPQDGRTVLLTLRVTSGS
jgi:outer membrane receptor for ferrienterochelin and colicins